MRSHLAPPPAQPPSCSAPAPEHALCREILSMIIRTVMLKCFVTFRLFSLRLSVIRSSWNLRACSCALDSSAVISLSFLLAGGRETHSNTDTQTSTLSKYSSGTSLLSALSLIVFGKPFTQSDFTSQCLIREVY